MTHEPDVENRDADSERTPMLGGSSRHGSSFDQDENKWSFPNILRFFGGGIYAPDPSTYDPIEILLNTEDERERDTLTVRWRDHKLSELSFVGVVVRLVNAWHSTDHGLLVGFEQRHQTHRACSGLEMDFRVSLVNQVMQTVSVMLTFTRPLF